MKKRAVGTLSFLVASTLLLTSCGTAAPKSTGPKTDLSSQMTTVMKASDPSKLPDLAKNRKDTLIIGIDAPDGVFNPLYAESAYDFYIYESIFDGLVDIDEQGNPIKGIAKSWDISADGLTYTFHMRDDVKFSDGTPVTADDVAFTYTVPCDSSYSGIVDVSAIGIKGWEDYNSGKTTSVEGIKVVDKNTIQFTLSQPNASAIYSLGAGILSKAYYGKDYKQGDTKSIEALHQKPMGCGQYKFVSYKDGEEVDLVANDSYYKGKPKIAKVIYKTTSEETRIAQLKTGETDIDMVTVNPQNVDQLKEAGFLDIQMFPTNGYGYMGMNLKDPIFTDVKVRQALTIGLNRKAIVNTVYKDYANVINEPQSKVAWTYTDDVNKYEFDAAAANKLLDDAGWKKGADGIREKDGQKLKINFSATTKNPVVDAIIPIAKDNYKALGIDFVAEMKDFNTLRADIKAGKFQMYFMAWGLTADPDQTAIFGSKGSQNNTFYSNAKVDQLLADGLKESNKDKRKTIYQNLYKEINKDVPYVFMYQRRDMWVVSSRVKNIATTPYKDFTYSLWNAELK